MAEPSFAEAPGAGGRAMPAAPLPSSARGDIDAAVRASGAEALVAVRDGRQVHATGAVRGLYNVASVRKSLVSALYGIAAERGLIDLDATLGELGVDEPGTPLTATEKSATVWDLLRARSGVYLPSIGESGGMKERRPARGSHRPGTFFYYNNWDFNALGVIFERRTGLTLGEAFTEWIAEPTGMRDFGPGNVVYQSSDDTELRMYRFYMSAGDLARFAALYADGGRWQGRQVVPREWVERTLARHSPVGYSDVYDGYGLLWWTDSERRLVWADGSGGQLVAVDPARRAAVVSLNDTGRSPLGVWWYGVTGEEADRTAVLTAVDALRGEDSA
ncbi:beta-lactamase family protein [Streptomyces radiopugnans]|nr:beta-lactamase family protein [Streptomyces radiopugnans]